MRNIPIFVIHRCPEARFPPQLLIANSQHSIPKSISKRCTTGTNFSFSF
jgi:hypothetical protein